MKYTLIIVAVMFNLALAENFSGTFQNDQGTGQITLQQAPDGSLQGSFTGANGQMQFQGYVNPQGAYGNLIGQDTQLAFQAQLSPDGNTLQLLIAPYGQNGQPEVNAAQQLTYRRVGVVQQNPTPTPQPLPVNPSQPTPLNPLAVNPVPQDPPSSSDGIPQPPKTPWQGTYQVAVYSQVNPNQKQTGVLTLQVTPMSDGNFHVISIVNGQPLVDITVTAVGINTTTGQEEFPLAWNTGKSSIYGVPGQLSTQNGMTLFSVQNGQDGAQAVYDLNGVLVAYKGCLSGECTEMSLGQ